MLFYISQEFWYFSGLSREPRLHIQRKRHLFKPLWSKSDTHPDKLMVLSHLSGSPFKLWGSLLWSMRCRGKAFQDSTRLIMGCLGEEPKVRKGMDLGDLGTHMGKQEKVNKRCCLLIYRLQFSAVLWPCTVLSRVCFMLLNSFSKDFSIVCAYVGV